jgi:hypothetical protein
LGCIGWCGGRGAGHTIGRRPVAPCRRGRCRGAKGLGERPLVDDELTVLPARHFAERLGDLLRA